MRGRPQTIELVRVKTNYLIKFGDCKEWIWRLSILISRIEYIRVKEKVPSRLCDVQKEELKENVQL